MDDSIAVVIPCYRVKARVLDLLARIGPEVARIYCVDDACPEGSGDHIEQGCRDRRVKVLRHAGNQGVGGAVMTGYRAALADGAGIVVKLDGDGQMDPALIGAITRPVAAGQADYTKGNRFYSLENLQGMPALRLIGNAVLSFMTKFSTGYWDIADPTNGFTAVHARVLKVLPLEKIARRWFFETDMMFRLNTLGAVVVDVPMQATYSDERSNLSIPRVLPEFLVRHMFNYAKRIFYNYFLRGFSIASVQLVLGLVLTVFGVSFSIAKWALAQGRGEFASAGTVMIGGLSIILGFQLLLSFLNEDMRGQPRVTLQSRLS
ncbi:MAG TPA: glycosyltransferase family 2 protein [Gammaproteobacteria bacterium]